LEVEMVKSKLDAGGSGGIETKILRRRNRVDQRRREVTELNRQGWRVVAISATEIVLERDSRKEEEADGEAAEGS
jgi:hypothetical protein